MVLGGLAALHFRVPARRALERSLTFVYMALTSIFGIARHPINN